MDLHQKITQAAAGSRADQTRAPAYAPIPATYSVRIARGRIDPDAVKVIRRLNRHGHVAYLVGGGVRDLLLARKPKDFDVGTSARPGQVRRLFRNCRLIGRRFRLAHILFSGGKIIEVATFRKDSGGNAHERSVTANATADRTGPSRPGPATMPEDPEHDRDLLIRRDNAYGDPHQDAIRRDFTINGLFYDIERQQVIDYVGGLPDLRRGVIRTIGRPDLRFREDPVRILRAIRFGARLDMGIEPEVYDAMVDQRGELRRSAPPRVLEEVLRLLRSGAAYRCIYLAWDVGVLNVLFPSLTAHLEDRAAGADRLWARLGEIDRMVLQQRLPGDAVLLTALLYEPMSEAAGQDRDPSLALKEIFADLTLRFALPRKIKDRMQRIFIAQQRLRQGNPRVLVQRDYYPDALSLFELGCRAEGIELPRWAAGRPAKKPRARSRRRKTRLR